MKGLARKLPPPAFILALVCFFLPFVTFSCGGQKFATFSGVQLATGTTLQRPQAYGPSASQKVDPEPLAVLALLAALAGLGSSFVKGKKGAVGSTVLAGLGVILLLALKSKLDTEALSQGGGAIQVSYGAGFYFVTVFLLAAAGASAYALLQGKCVSLLAVKGTANSKFCTQCGARNAESALFCGECGSRFPQ